MNHPLDRYSSSGRAALLTGLAMMLVWGAFAIYYYTERLYGDSAFYLFKLINEKEYIIEHKRPAGIMMQVLPMILLKLYAPIKVIILAYSLNEWLWYLFSFIFISLKLKSPSMALAMVFTLVFGVRWNFYNPISELLLGTPFLFMVLAILQKEDWSVKHWIALALLIPLICFNHPLFGFILPACLALAVILASNAGRKRIAGCLLFAFAIMAARYYSLDDYEKGMVTDANVSFADHLKLLDEFYFKQFFAEIIPLFAGTCALGLLLLPSVRKRPLFMAALAALLIGYLLLLIWQFGDYYTSRYEMFERYLYPLTVLTCFAFFSVAAWQRSYVVVLLAILGIYHFILVEHNGRDVVIRYAQLERAIRYAGQFKEDKVAFRGDNYNTIHYGKEWFIGNEAMLLSARRGPEFTKQIYVLEGPGMDVIRQQVDDQYFYAPWWSASMKHLNTRYFQMDATATRFANTDSVQAVLSLDFLEGLRVQCTYPQSDGVPTLEGTFSPGEAMLLPVVFTNANSTPLFSGMQKQKIGWTYSWYDASGETVAAEEKISPLVADLYKTLEQEIVVYAPRKQGTYTLQLYLQNGELRHKITEAWWFVEIR